MLPDRVWNPGPLTYESGALPIALEQIWYRYMKVHGSLGKELGYTAQMAAMPIYGKTLNIFYSSTRPCILGTPGLLILLSICRQQNGIPMGF